MRVNKLINKDIDEIKTTISPEEFKKRMKDIKLKYEQITHDTEEVHIEMDNLILDTLSGLGYEEGVKIFRNTHRWYT